MWVRSIVICWYKDKYWDCKEGKSKIEDLGGIACDKHYFLFVVKNEEHSGMRDMVY